LEPVLDERRDGNEHLRLDVQEQPEADGACRRIQCMDQARRAIGTQHVGKAVAAQRSAGRASPGAIPSAQQAS
jgi:hypothetical protein